MTTTLRLLLLASAALAPSLLATSAHADSVPVERPRFCGSHKPDLERRHYHELADSIELSDQALNEWATLACDKPDVRMTQERIAEVRRAMVARWGISVESTNAALGARLDIKTYEAELTSYCHGTEKKIDTTAREIAHASALSRLADCTKGTDADWVMDEHPDAPQIWRAAVVMSCFQRTDLTRFDERIAEQGNDLQRMVHITAYARCALDLQALDRAKLVAELDKESLVTPRVKIAILENVDQTKAWADKVTAAYKAQAVKNPDVQAVAFDAPAAASAAWIKRYNEIKSDFDVVIDVERGAETGRRASKGCAAKVRPVLARLLARAAPKSMTDAEALVGDAFINRTLRALAYCEDLEGHAAAAVCLLPASTAPRGPRDSAVLAAVAKLKEIQAAEPNKTRLGDGITVYGGSRVGEQNLEISVGGTCYRDEPAVIKSIKKAGDTATITFKTESQQRMGRSCRDTRRLQSVDPANGTFKYYQDCVDTGMVTVKTTLAPLETLAAYTTGLAPGQAVIVGRRGMENVGLPLIGFSDAKAAKVGGLYGQK